MSDGGAGPALLQRVVLPADPDRPDILALYVDTGDGYRRPAAMDRFGLTVPAGARVSLASYFNAFPAGYWHRWTMLRAIRLGLAVRGCGRVEVYRSRADGTSVPVATATHDGDGPGELGVTLDLAPFADGGWYWFDLIAPQGNDFMLSSGGWYATVPAPGRASVAVGMPTFDKPDDCLAALGVLAADPVVLGQVTSVVLVDQGRTPVCDHPRFAVLSERLGSRLRYVRQTNLGANGGYARAMWEALRGDCAQIVFMDDDVVVEPEAVPRAVAFSRFARCPMLVGAQTLDATVPSLLSSTGEVVDRRRFMLRAAPGAPTRHDFASTPLRATPALHHRVDIDYNGWWTCLIPREVAERIGLPLPLSLTWDDAEYALRATAAGFPTAAVPGIAVWHAPWADRDDPASCVAYYLIRNRLVAAALHTDVSGQRAVVWSSLGQTLKNLMSMDYPTVTLQLTAIRDFLAGPGRLPETLRTGPAPLRALWDSHPNSRMVESTGMLPAPSLDVVAANRLSRQSRAESRWWTACRVLLHNTTAPRASQNGQPQLIVSARQSSWQLLGRLDSAAVTTHHGRGVHVRHRDRAAFWRLLRRTLAAHLRLAWRMRVTSARYRKARTWLTSAANWERLFTARPPGPAMTRLRS